MKSQNKAKASTRGRANSPEPGTRFITSSINCAEINRACDAFFVRTIPGYRVMSIGGITPKRTA